FHDFHRPCVRARYRRWWTHHLRGRTGRENHTIRPGSACRGLRHGTDPGAATQNECSVRRKLVFQQSRKGASFVNNPVSAIVRAWRWGIALIIAVGLLSACPLLTGTYIPFFLVCF